ncbi:MAG: acyltransferase [Steroidobacteraceae bacterium]
MIDEPCSIGAGTRIWHFSHVMRDSSIGARCTLGQNVLISSRCNVGSNVKIQNNVSVYTGVTIEDDVFLGPSMVFTNVINPRAYIERKAEFRPTLVRRGTTIGANATIVCGVTLGEYCLVGAGSVVTRDVRPYAVVYGNPARQRGWACWCGATLPASVAASPNPTLIRCRECDRRYEQNGTSLARVEAD